MTNQRQMDVEQFIQLYITIFDETPDRRMLQVLSDYLLHEDLSNSNAHKSTVTEYPILSKRQLKRRIYGEQGSRATNQNGEVALERAARYGVDGREYRLPVRRSRAYTSYEK
ncbi:hypothetical protein DUZ99_08810 [Xylanibacillus composti]|uniref:Uncharacterized protein n=1 Tax=Xylanibacillus composti TaxID=1572762 RepID=A0A8J4M4P4_9BACL|nr:hypothetical protein [Xylanibacillus composti]MDT9725096.1 hypothetical protein [Xylanibacillus composti]GIQ70911.1 hypothetical protein XYCOK13_37350 [Xylanibacillus composti]